MNEANELITWLGVKIKPGAKEVVATFNKGLGSINSEIGRLDSFFFGAGGAIGYFKDQIMGGSQELLKLSENTGVSIEKLQQWKYAAKVSGVSFEGLLGNLENFKKLGIDALSMSSKLSKVSMKTALQMKDKFGLSDDMFNLLRQGPEKVQNLLRSANVIPEEKIKEAAQTNLKIQETLAQIDELTREIMIEVVPIVLEAVKFINEFIKENKEWIKENLGPLLKGMLALFAGQKILDLLQNLQHLALLGVISKVINDIYDLFKDFVNKGVENTVDEIDEDIETGKATVWDLLNPAKAIAREYGHAGRDIANWFSTPAEESFQKAQEAFQKYRNIKEEKPKIRLEQTSMRTIDNSTTNQNSGNTYIVQVANEQQASNIMNNTEGPYQRRPVVPGAMVPNIS